MILAKEAIEKAADWWAERILEDRPHSNGDNSFTSVTACLLADMGRQNITPNQADTFKKAFAERFDDGKYDSKPLDGWALDCERICGVGDLCPDCFKAYREAMDGFWNGGKHGT